ncbi:FAD-dependent oxidoreductase [Mycobacteroides abscessus]|uniref:FAD-dependent oxidoreductase n=1 Tax=Mycobacteroides abscessus TaxID=36809 RepID=UPI0031338F37
MNTGCRPTKALVASAMPPIWRVRPHAGASSSMLREHGHGPGTGTQGCGDPASRNGGQTWLKDLGCAIYHEHASFLSPTELSVGDEIISAERIFLNVGAAGVVPDWPGVDDVPLFTNSSLIEYDGIPEHLVVIGAATSAWNSHRSTAGSAAQVTVVHRGPRLVEREDPDASAIIQEVLEREGITFRLNASCINLARHDEGVAAGVVGNTGRSRQA